MAERRAPGLAGEELSVPDFRSRSAVESESGSESRLVTAGWSREESGAGSGGGLRPQLPAPDFQVPPSTLTFPRSHPRLPLQNLVKQEQLAPHLSARSWRCRRVLLMRRALTE